MNAGSDPTTLVHRLIEDVWNTGDAAAADWLVDRNFVDHSAPPGVSAHVSKHAGRFSR